MARLTDAQRLERMREKRKESIKAEKELESKISSKNRKIDAHCKILLGAITLKMMKDDIVLKSKIMAALDTELTRNHERDYFGLKPLKPVTPAKKAAKEPEGVKPVPPCPKCHKIFYKPPDQFRPEGHLQCDCKRITNKGEERDWTAYFFSNFARAYELPWGTFSEAEASATQERPKRDS